MNYIIIVLTTLFYIIIVLTTLFYILYIILTKTCTSDITTNVSLL